MKTLAIIPILLALAVYGIWSQNKHDISRVDIAPLISGFGLLAIVALWYATISTGNVAATFAIGIPALIGLLFIGIGSILLAYRLRIVRGLPRWIAFLFALALPTDPLFNAVVTPVIGGGISLYGLAWIVLGVHLWRDSHPGIEQSQFNESQSLLCYL
ncbi:hypothetical protein ACFQH3_08665 [Haladaptatus sp. GCM10025707]